MPSICFYQVCWNENIWGEKQRNEQSGEYKLAWILWLALCNAILFRNMFSFAALFTSSLCFHFRLFENQSSYSISENSETKTNINNYYNFNF